MLEQGAAARKRPENLCLPLSPCIWDRHGWPMPEAFHACIPSCSFPISCCGRVIDAEVFYAFAFKLFAMNPLSYCYLRQLSQVSARVDGQVIVLLRLQKQAFCACYLRVWLEIGTKRAEAHRIPGQKHSRKLQLQPHPELSPEHCKLRHRSLSQSPCPGLLRFPDFGFQIRYLVALGGARNGCSSRSESRGSRSQRAK